MKSEFMASSRLEPKWFLLIQILVVLALLSIGGLYVWFEVSSADNQKQTALLNRTLLMSEAFDTDLLKSLSGTPSDIDKPEYLRLKKQLILLKKDNPDIRFIYLMGYRSDRTVFFFADSEPPGAADYSPPGQIYTEGSSDLRTRLKKGREFVKGPNYDRWGIWISAFTPVVDPLTGRNVAFVGVDVNAGAWRQMLIQAGLPGALLTLLLTGTALIWLRLFYHRHRLAANGPKWVQYRDIICVLIAGTILSVYAAWRVYALEVDNRARTFRQIAFSQTGQIGDIFKNIRSSWLEGFSAFLYHNRMIPQQEFQRYSQKLTQNPLIHAWLWAPAVPVDQARTAENRIRKEQNPDFKISPSEPDELAATAIDGLVFPILYAEPKAGNFEATGFNLGSEPKRREAIREAVRSKMPVASVPVWRGNNPAKEKIIMVYRPVFSPDQDNLLLGIAAVALRVASLENRSEVNANLVKIELSVLQDQPQITHLVLFNRSSRNDEKCVSRRYIFAFGRVFCLSACPGPEFIEMYPIWKWGAVLLIGLAFTAASAVIAGLIASRRRELERLVAERTEKLIESEFRFHQLCQYGRTLVWDIDEQGFFTFVNDVSATLLGYLPHEMIGRIHFYDLCPEVDREVLKTEIFDLFNQQKPFSNVETRLRTKDGRLIWVSSQGMPLWNSAGKAAGYRGECIDISNRKLAEEEKERQIKYQILLTQVAATYINLPPDQLNVAIERSLAELGAFLSVDRFYIFEFDYERQLCSNTYEWCAPNITSQLDRLRHIPFADIRWCVDAFMAGKTVNIPDVASLPAGDKVRLILESQQTRSLINVPMMEDNRCLGFIGFDAVRKHHVYTEEEGRLLQVFAQMLVNVRSRYRLEANLRQEQKAAQAANRAKSDFLTNMSHEIRTPINGVIGVADLLGETRLDGEQRNLVEIIQSSGNLLLELVNEILDFSRIEAKKIELHFVDFDLDQLLRELAGGLALAAHAKKIELVLAVAPEIPAGLHGDSTRIRQILMNLTGNAVKFTEHGEVVIGVSLENQTEDSLLIRFSVRDTGIGIAASKFPFLFDPFFQADSSIQRKYGGSGLGLPISKGLVEELGGKLSFSSEAGVGSEFSFVIPLTRAAADAAEPPMPAAWQGARILVADDNCSVRRMLAKELAAHSLRPVETADGAAVIELLRQALASGEPFFAVLIDWSMPGVNPAALAAEIRLDPGLAGIQLVAMLPLGTRVEHGCLIAAGFSGTLSKPIGRKELAAWFHAADLSHSQAMAEPLRQAGALPPPPEPEIDSTDILLAEDNSVNQKVMVLMLKKLGLKVDIAQNGREVLAMLQQKSYRVVLMDVQMPEMDGLEAARRIRDPASPVRNRQIPIVAVTAHAVEGYQETCLAAGMDDYLTKPVTPQKLRNILARWLLELKIGG